MSKEQKKKAFSLALLRRIFSFTAPYKKTLYTSIVLAIILAVITPLRPYLIKLSVDKYITKLDWTGLLWISLFQLGVLLVESFFRFWFAYRTNWLGQTAVNDMRKAVFTKILFQNIGFYDRTPIGTLTTRTINDVESVNDIFSEGIISIGADTLTILSIIAVMLYTDWRLTLVCLSTFPVLIIATYVFKEAVNKSFQRVRKIS